MFHLRQHTQARQNTTPIDFVALVIVMASKSSRQPSTRPETILTRRQVEGLIADGKAIIVVDQKVLKVDPWIQYHPGGWKAILHMVGRDATDELNA